MNDSSERNPVEALAEEFLDRIRRGERPALSEYTRRHPELASEIRDLFPALVMLEDVRPPTVAGTSAGNVAAPAAGKTLERLGDYRILREVGRGGMGIVYEAEQESLGRHVALKVLPSYALLEPQQLQRFQREARAAARLHHTNIVPVFGVGEAEGLHYYVMQFIQGQGLDQVLAELLHLRRGLEPVPPSPEGAQQDSPGQRPGTWHRPGTTPAKLNAEAVSALAVARSLLTGVFANPARGQETAIQPEDASEPVVAAAVSPCSSVSSSSSGAHLPGQPDRTLSDSGRLYWQSVAHIGIQVAEALAYAHSQGTLHRDIKPSNLLLDTQGVVWVTDFGLAKASDSEDLTNTGDVVGTLRYMAPERFKGKGDARSDVYALGLTLYELLTLRPAFAEVERGKLLHQVIHDEPIRPRKVNPAVPRDLETIILKAIARDPAHRYGNATELAEDLKRFQDDKPIHARRVSETEKLWRWCRRHPGVAGLAAAFVLTLLLGISLTSWKWREADTQRREAEEAKQETARQRDKAIRARNASQRMLAETMLDKGIVLAEQGEIGEGLCWLLEALQIAEEDSGENSEEGSGVRGQGSENKGLPDPWPLTPDPSSVRQVAPDLARLVRTNLAGWLSQTHSLEQLARVKREKLEEGFWCAFTQDGQRFVTATGNAVQMWDGATGRSLGPALVLKNTVALSPDGTMLLTKTDPGADQRPQLQRRDAHTGQPLGAPLDHPQDIQAVVFAPDGKQIATGCEDGMVRLWDSSTGKLRRAPLAHDGLWIASLAFSPDGNTLAVGSRLPTKDAVPAATYLWDLSSGQRLGSPLGQRTGGVSVAFSPDSKKALSSDWDGTVQSWDSTTGKPLGPALRHPKAALALRFTPDGRTIVTGGQDGVLRWWDSATGLQLIGTLPMHKAHVTGLALSADGRMLGATVSWPKEPGEMSLYRIARDVTRPAPRSKEGIFKAPWGPADGATWYHWTFASYSPDRSRVVIGSKGGHAHLCDTLTGQPASLPGNLGRPRRHSWPWVDVTAFSPDGRYFATSSRAQTAVGDALLWDSTSGRLIASLPQINYVAAMVFSPDSKILATGGYDCAVYFWDSATGKPIGPPLLQGEIVQGLAFSPDGKTLAVGHAQAYSGASRVVLWDVASRKQLGKAEPRPGVQLRYSPDGKELLAVGGPNLTLLDARPAGHAGVQPLWPTITETGAINSVQWGPDGRSMLLTTTDGTVRLRDRASGKPIGVPMLHPAAATVAAFSPDAEAGLILVGYADGSARLWDRATHKPIGPPVAQNSPIRGVTFLPDGHAFVTTAEDGTTRLWPVPLPVTEPLDLLRLRLQVRTRLQMSEGQVVQILEPEEWEQRRQLLADKETGRQGDRETAAVVSLSRFHDARARDAEQDGDTFAARWHLNALLAEGGAKDWLCWARRARTWTDANQLEQAEADYAQAQQRAASEQLLCWYRHRIVANQAAGRWSVVVWYLNRALALAPNDWQLYADRAQAHEKLGKLAECEADWAAAVARGGDRSCLVHLAETHARQVQWARAAAAFAAAGERGPAALGECYCHALVCLKAGDAPGYRRICERLLQQAGPKLHPGLANSLAWACAVGPDAVSDYARPLALAELALEKVPPQARPLVLNTLGALLYRAGRFQEAAGRLRQSIQANGSREVPQDWIFLAMTQHRLGETVEARKSFARVKHTRAANAETLWNNIEVELLRQEAQELVEGKGIPSPPVPLP